VWLKKNCKDLVDLENYCERWHTTPARIYQHVSGGAPLHSITLYLAARDTKPALNMEDLMREFLARRAFKANCEVEDLLNNIERRTSFWGKPNP
jgi:hypothetical protein